MIANNRIKISFELDEAGRPIDIKPYQKTDANSLVEEVSPCSFSSGVTRLTIPSL